MNRLPFRGSCVLLLLAVALGCGDGAGSDSAGPYDLVIAGGRVMDPDSGLDAVRHVGIRAGEIVAISETSLDDRLVEGGTVIDADGMVVAPGFIDLHAHGQSDDAFRYRARDGVTTALEMEWGYPLIGEWLASRAGKARIHYGTTVAHGYVRALAMSDPGDVERPDAATLSTAATAGEPLVAFEDVPLFEASLYRELPDADLEELFRLMKQGLDEGALGVGVAHQYYPGASHREIFRVFEFAAEEQVPIYTHVRAMEVGAMQEVVANAAATGAALHIVHVNSMSGGELPVILELIRGARERGVDVTTETYPYTAASTGIDSAIFDDGWQERLGISYGDLQWQDTGERLTAETFERYHEEGGVVIIHFMSDEIIDLAVGTPWVMIASDAMPYAPGAHPRSAGTYARVLGRYVRERGVLDLMTALRKMSLDPARRVEAVAPAMRKKGRVALGADADLVVFDAETVIDRATFEEGLDFSTGIREVLVSGTLVVRGGELVDGVFPGQPVLGGAAAGR